MAPRVLFVDSYDSYSYNIYQLILDVLPDADIIVVRNDQYTADEVDAAFVASFDFIIIGPGPGDPRNPKDTGFLLRLFDFDTPILGVCLGFQLLCLRFGGEIAHLAVVKHGQISSLQPKAGSLYTDDEPFPVTRYHSIMANVTGASDVLEELAYVEDGEPNGRVCMAARHRSKPFYAVQYHAESICSARGADLVRNFWHIAQAWNTEHRPARAEIPAHLSSADVRPKPLTEKPTQTPLVVDTIVLNGRIPAPDAAEVLDAHLNQRITVLESVSAPGRYSVIGAIGDDDGQVTYSLSSGQLDFLGRREKCDISTVYCRLAEYAAQHKLVGFARDHPFCGGFIGYFSYEAGVAGLDVRPAEEVSRAPDVNFVLVSRSIVIDHREGLVYVQSARHALTGHGDDKAWLSGVSTMLRDAIAQRSSGGDAPVELPSTNVHVTMPTREDYVAQVKAAQRYLAQGESYELCLTGQTDIRCGRQSAWTLYRALRQRNPAPYACCIQLPGMALVSSSPERFVSVSQDGRCQLRPIKGTVRKYAGLTREQATDMLRTPKELAENLMIVDLIRHDLHQIARDVSVPLLMSVEEYASVYQLVSVIQGSVDAPFSCVDVLAHSLPPGSMTGAPKKRSVELLARLEGRNRGIYSGVCGYMSLCGASDWSVVIRSAFRYDVEQDSDSGEDLWHVGAGGAITALSDPEAEYEEMQTKLNSALPAFGVASGAPSR